MHLQLVEHAAHKQGASRSMRLEIVGNHDGHTSTKLRTSHGGPHLLAEDISRPSRGHPPIEPAIAPVEQTKAVDLAVITGLCWLLMTSVREIGLLCTMKKAFLPQHVDASTINMIHCARML